jgi:hypothetical protein
MFGLITCIVLLAAGIAPGLIMYSRMRRRDARWLASLDEHDVQQVNVARAMILVVESSEHRCESDGQLVMGEVYAIGTEDPEETCRLLRRTANDFVAPEDPSMRAHLAWYLVLLATACDSDARTQRRATAATLLRRASVSTQELDAAAEMGFYMGHATGSGPLPEWERAALGETIEVIKRQL